MDDDSTYVIRVSLELRDLFRGIVVVDTKLKIIAADNYPVLPGNKSSSSNRNICCFECFDNGLHTSR